MGAWSPREAAEYRAAADAELLRRIARTDAAARRGIHRLAGIACVAGYGEITVAGVKLRQPAAVSQEGAEPSGSDGRRRTGPSKQRRSSARAAKHRALCATADRNRLRRVFQVWHQQCRRSTPQEAERAEPPPQQPARAAPPAASAVQPPPIPPVSPMQPPAPDAPSDADVRAAEAHQQVCSMEDERAPKRDAPPSPAVDESPRAKRTLPSNPPLPLHTPPSCQPPRERRLPPRWKASCYQRLRPPQVQ